MFLLNETHSEDGNVVEIVKWDGRREQFDLDKLRHSILRLGAPLELAKSVSEQIEREAYSGMTSKEIFDLVTAKLRTHEPAISLREDLKTGLARMKGGSEFEEYVRLIFRAHGYSVKGNTVVQGRCVTHEIDGIAERDDECIYLEIKHHSSPHSYTPFDVTLAAKAKWDDLQSGHESGSTSYCFNRVLVVSNTRLSAHARQYAECVGIGHLGWNTPPGRGLDCMIEEKGLYPITVLKALHEEERDILSGNGILTLQQLEAATTGVDGIQESRFNELKDQAAKIMKTRLQENCDSVRQDLADTKGRK
ncbi:MAG: hypothetical protein C4K48_12955 [Candidatus Thorarchaeota archaeon]|nr:MAG: hypothetical protein C4K48_12955 [Candidatus Thorarchaeota archaeon]